MRIRRMRSRLDLIALPRAAILLLVLVATPGAAAAKPGSSEGPRSVARRSAVGKQPQAVAQPAVWRQPQADAQPAVGKQPQADAQPAVGKQPHPEADGAGLQTIEAAPRGRLLAAQPRLALDVLLVNDPDFPPVTPEAARAILAHARATLADKLDFPDVEFRIEGRASVADFIRRNSDPAGDCARYFEPLRVRPGVRRASQIDPKLVDDFLSRWSVESLQAFFPEDQRVGLGSYAAIRGKLLSELDRKVTMIAGFRLPGGRSLLAPETLDQRSYVSWMCAVRNQDEADLILTNAFILYDLASEPYPHSIFAKCKVGGASLLSPKRRAIYRRAVVASTFSVVTDLPFFKEAGIESVSAAERLAIIGTFIVAHELGHAVFKLPDFYDHPPQCLMTTKLDTGYVSGFRTLQAHPGACPKCQPWVEAKSHVFLAEQARAAGKPDVAIEQLRLAIRMTPKHVDGSYLRYIADLSQQVAEIYAEQGNLGQARRWVDAALRIAPSHEEARRLKASLDAHN